MWWLRLPVCRSNVSNKNIFVAAQEFDCEVTKLQSTFQFETRSLKGMNIFMMYLDARFILLSYRSEPESNLFSFRRLSNRFLHTLYMKYLTNFRSILPNKLNFLLMPETLALIIQFIGYLQTLKPLPLRRASKLLCWKFLLNYFYKDILRDLSHFCVKNNPLPRLAPV